MGWVYNEEEENGTRERMRGRKLYFSKEDCEFCEDRQTQGKQNVRLT